MAFDPTGKRVIGEAYGKTIEWDAQTGGLVRSFEGEPESVVASADDRQLLIHYSTGALLVDVTHARAKGAIAQAYSSDRTRMAIGNRDGSVRIRNARTNSELIVFQVSTKAIQSVDFSLDGAFLVSSISENNAVHISDSIKGIAISSVLHDSPINVVAISPDGRLAATGDDVGTIKIFDIPTGRIVSSLQLEADHSVGVAPSTNGTRMVTLGTSGFRVWDLKTGKQISYKDSVHNTLAHSCAPSDCDRFATAHDSRVRIWDLTGGIHTDIKAHDQGVQAVAFSPDGLRLLSGGKEPIVKLWDVKTGRLVQTFARNLWLHKLLSALPERLLSTIAPPGGWLFKMIERQLGHRFDVTTVAFSQNGDRIASGGRGDRKLLIWDVPTGALVGALEVGDDVTGTDTIRSSGFSSDGRLIFAATHSGKVSVWDIVSFKRIAAFDTGDGRIWSAAISRDGASIITGGSDKEVKLWDVRTGSLRHRFGGHLGEIVSVAFLNDGQRMVSASLDGTTRLWSLSDRSEYIRWLSNKNGQRWVAMTSAGFFDFEGDLEGIVHIVRGVEVITVGQAFGHLYRPDLVFRH